MNLKESIAYIKAVVSRREPAHYVKEFTIDNETLGNIVAELERLWRIEECAQKFMSVYEVHGGFSMGDCENELKEALAAKGQE